MESALALPNSWGFWTYKDYFNDEDGTILGDKCKELVANVFHKIKSIEDASEMVFNFLCSCKSERLLWELLSRACGANDIFYECLESAFMEILKERNIMIHSQKTLLNPYPSFTSFLEKNNWKS